MTIQANTTAFLFPGQGSQTLGMGKELYTSSDSARKIFDLADDILGYSLSTVMWEGPEETLNDTKHTQPALFVHSLAAWASFQNIFPNFQPAFFAGHSLGELSALAAAGATSFEEGLRLVQQRGQLMKQAGELHPGSMAAILGLDINTVHRICNEASSKEEIVQVANDNCPGQVVVSGADAAVDRLVPIASDAGARKVVKLAVSIAAHSPLMAHISDAFSLAVNETPIQNPSSPIIGNVQAKPLIDTDAVRTDLKQQLTSQVRWTETVEFLVNAGIENYLEFGPGTVLCGLVKRIDRGSNRYSIGSPEDLAAFDL